MIIPSIDLMDGKAVQLKQGREKVLEREDVLDLAKYYARFGEIAVVDLDAAMGKGDNEALIAQICKVAQCRVGGGIRSVEKAKRMISMGAKKLVIGTAADENFLSQLPKERIIVAIDSRNGKITLNGWQSDTEFSTESYVRRFGDFCSGFLYTIVEKEGLMEGTNLEAFRRIREITNLPITAAGGITTLEEIQELEKLNISSQLGMAIYTGKIRLEDAFCACLNFEKESGLIPTIVQDEYSKQVLMLAYSSRESLEKSLQTGKASYFSRSRKELWTKGDTSGNCQELLNAKFDCDCDTVLFKVKQTGNACHLERYSCFEDKEFTLASLFEIILDRKANMPEKSYTAKLFNDDFFLKRKIMEEAFEVVNFEYSDSLGWEAADFIYHFMVFLARHNVNWQDVVNYLASRSK